MIRAGATITPAPRLTPDDLEALAFRYGRRDRAQRRSWHVHPGRRGCCWRPVRLRAGLWGGVVVMTWKHWVLIAWLAFSGIVMIVRGVVGQTKTYTMGDALGAFIEISLAIWLVSTL